METVKLCLILSLLLLSNVLCQEKDAGNWRAETGKSKWPNTGIVQDLLSRLNRKPGERQYIGVLRRKGSDKMQTTRKRHRFQTFIGLMGKRSFNKEGGL